MPNKPTFDVVALPHSWIADDGSAVELEFRGSRGEKVRLRFAGDLLDHLLGHVAELLATVRSQSEAISGHLEIRAPAVVAAAAIPSVGGSAVLVSLRASSGLPYHFALPPDLADELRVDLEESAKTARAQARQTRQ